MTKRILVNTELVGVVKKFIECGINVVCTSCCTYDMYLGNTYKEKVTLIQIDFGRWYPDEIFLDLPCGWHKYECNGVKDNMISKFKYSAISCSERHPAEEKDDESIEFCKMIMISNLDRWLDEIDPQGFKAVWILKGLY